MLIVAKNYFLEAFFLVAFFLVVAFFAAFFVAFFFAIVSSSKDEFRFVKQVVYLFIIVTAVTMIVNRKK